MIIDLTQELRDFDGRPMSDSENGKPTTLGTICSRALLAIFPDEQNLSGEQKFQRYKLAMKLAENDRPDLKAEEIADLKKLIGKAFSAMVVGRCWEMLDPDPPKTNGKGIENPHEHAGRHREAC